MFLSRGQLTRKLTGVLFVVLCLASLLGPGAVAPVQAQHTCAALLNDADQKIYVGLFDDALELVDRCLTQPDVTASTKALALRLKALAYDGKNYVGQARDTIRELLRLAPDYQVDQVQDPPSFRELVEQVRKEMQSPTPEPPPVQKKSGAMKWILIGGGTVGAAAIAAIVLGNGGGNGGGNGVVPPPHALPNPPPLP
ncbi:MAG: hypothetical protein ACREOO_25225 [bacterium]